MANPQTAAHTIERHREAERAKYLKLATEREGYGATNHGRHAYATVIEP